MTDLGEQRAIGTWALEWRKTWQQNGSLGVIESLKEEARR